MPLGGVIDISLIRDLLDLDSWLSSDKLPAKTHQESRGLLWEGIIEQNCPTTTLVGISPESLNNSRKVTCKSPAPTTGIQPFNESTEKVIVTKMLVEKR